MKLRALSKRLLGKVKTHRRKALITALIVGVLAGSAFLLTRQQKNIQASIISSEMLTLDALPIVVPTMRYGFAIDTFQVMDGTIQNGQVLGAILSKYGVDNASVEKLVANATPVFDIRQLRAGKTFTVLTKDSTQRADYFIYEPNVYEYIVFELNNDLQVERVKRPVDTERHAAAGLIESSLWNAMVQNGMPFELASKMEDALQWSIDFHHLQHNDEFKLVFDQNSIEGEVVGIDKVHAAYYRTGETEFHAIWYEHPEFGGYYDLEGRPMKKSFLKAPVKYSRISSHYNLKRFHPVLKRTRPHLGTDYAAPHGTEIYAVGDGVVVEAAYGRGNGNFVKIKHNDTYQTQYLHMSKFAAGIRKGVHVRQGQVIGYVGSTGLATGPHVCFRFWMNGKQVNHLKLNFPPPEPLPESELPDFFEIRDSYMALIKELEARPVQKTLTSNEETVEETIEEETHSM